MSVINYVEHASEWKTKSLSLSYVVVSLNTTELEFDSDIFSAFAW